MPPRQEATPPNADGVVQIQQTLASARFRAFIHEMQHSALLAYVERGVPEAFARDRIHAFFILEAGDLQTRMENLLERLERLPETLVDDSMSDETSASTTTTTPHALANGNSDASQVSGHVQDSTIPVRTLQTQSNSADIPGNGETAGLQSQPPHSSATTASTAKPQMDNSPATENGNGNGVSGSGNSPTTWDSDEETVVERDEDEVEDEDEDDEDDGDDDDDGASTSERILVALDPEGVYLPQTTYDPTAASQQGDGHHLLLPNCNGTLPATDGADETSPDSTESSSQWNAAQMPRNDGDGSPGQAQNTNTSVQTQIQSSSDEEKDETPGGDQDDESY